MGTVHIVGAGLAGLACAVKLVKAGRKAGNKVCVYEATRHAGGRCRSFDDSKLGRRIDNGNHLTLSGNRSLMEYMGDIGAAGALTGPREPEFEFLDIKSGLRWTIRPNGGPIPWWIFSPSRRVPTTSAGDYLEGVRLGRSGPDATVAGCLDNNSQLYRRFWEPLTVAVLNTPAHEAAAGLLWAVIRETFMRGGAACRPLMARVGLSESFIDPAMAFLGHWGCRVQFNRRIKSMDFGGDRVRGLDLEGERIGIGDGDSVVLAVPPCAAAGLVAGLSVPSQGRAIVNAHFILPKSMDRVSILGLIGGLGQWLFVRGDVASVTISAAGSIAGDEAGSIARLLWPEVALALGLGEQPPGAYRIIKERRATFAQTPEQSRMRPSTESNWKNLFLAGDWTDTGLPATIEGAVRSGQKAAMAILHA
ncbi:MAG: hydroxysqualene dehydroxylase HpnE [Rhodospirillales bacterium]